LVIKEDEGGTVVIKEDDGSGSGTLIIKEDDGSGSGRSGSGTLLIKDDHKLSSNSTGEEGTGTMIIKPEEGIDNPTGTFVIKEDKKEIIEGDGSGTMIIKEDDSSSTVVIKDEDKRETFILSPTEEDELDTNEKDNQQQTGFVLIDEKNPKHNPNITPKDKNEDIMKDIKLPSLSFSSGRDLRKNQRNKKKNINQSLGTTPSNLNSIIVSSIQKISLNQPKKKSISNPLTAMTILPKVILILMKKKKKKSSSKKEEKIKEKR